MKEKGEKIESFMSLYKPVQQQLSAYCRALTGNESAAFDLLHDTLVAAFDGFDGFKAAKSANYYLCGIARNIFLNQKRRWKFWGNSNEITISNIKIQPEEIELQPDIKLLYKAIEKLSFEQREVLVLFYIMGFQGTEIASQMGITEAAVRNRLKRARERLRLLMSDSESYSKHVNTIEL